jgi:hypothetical protein
MKGRTRGLVVPGGSCRRDLLLVSTDFSESDGTRPVPVGLLDTTGSWGSLPGSLGSDYALVQAKRQYDDEPTLLSGSLSSGGFTGGLLGSGHCESELSVGWWKLSEVLKTRNEDECWMRNKSEQWVGLYIVVRGG